jgi:hypothetical protein
MVSRYHGGVGGGNLIAVDAVGQPEDGGKALDELLRLGCRSLARIVELLHPRSNLGQAAQVGFRADHGVD